jgi:mRNA-degrading endonuclease RelE of RelBE toxin-antitoxin system
MENNIQEIQKQFTDTINNTGRYLNTTDQCHLMGYDYTYNDNNAIPFIVYYFNGKKCIYFGKNGTTHNASCTPIIMLSFLRQIDFIEDGNLVKTICQKVLEVFNDNYIRRFDTINNYNYNYEESFSDDYWLYENVFNMASGFERIEWVLKHQKDPNIIDLLPNLYDKVFRTEQENPYGHVRARIYMENIPELKKKCAFIGTWHKIIKETCDFILSEFKEEYGVVFTDCYLFNDLEPMINIFGDFQEKQQTQNMKNQFFIHLMGQKEKKDALADFRKTRDEKNARKLGKMTQAQYNALRYVDENKKPNKRKFIFTEAQIKHIIKENMNNELANYPQSFNMDTFKSLNSYNKKIQYCNQYLQRIASGSSRIVYKIDDATVLKLAKNQKGIAQNEAETQYRDDMYAPNIFAEVYDNDENFYWIEMQLAKKAKPSDFKRLTGYDFKTFQNFVTYSAQQYLPRRSYGFSIPSEYKQLFDSEEFQNMVWDNPDNVFYQTNEYLTSYQIEKYGDVQRISSWGVVKDKHDGTDKLVLIDYGLTDDIFNQYYSR